MKVLIAISDSFCANFIKGQALFLKDKGCEVILVSSAGYEIRKMAKDENVRLIEIPFSREISILQDLKSLYLVLKLLRKEQPDIVNAGNPKTGFLFMIAGVLFPKTKKIFTLRGIRSDTLKGLKKKIVFFTEWVSCSLANKVIVISPSLKEHAIKIGVLKEEKAIVLGKGSSNGVDIKRFSRNETNLEKAKCLRDKFEVKETDIVIGYVGRITRDKGIEELYAAFKNCQRSSANIKLFLAGPIEEDDSVSIQVMEQMEANKNVVFLGKQSNIEEVYLAYDILVLYSYREGFGNVALEASSMGVPTIVSNIPGAKDTTENMASGLHVESRDPIKLAEAMQFYIDNADIRKKHGEYGISRARDFFSSEVIWNGQYKLYQSLVK